MSGPNWDKEMAKIDKQIESISDEELFPKSAAKTPTQRAAVVEQQRTTSTLGVFARLVLAVALGIGMLFWPYGHRCGLPLFGYVAAAGVLVVAGVWSGIWTWRHRAGKAHVLSLLLVLWGIVLGALEILPRVGYAKPDAAHPAVWTCE